MIMFTVGFTFTYMMEGFPNFAHTTYAAVGGVVSFYMTKFYGVNPYLTWPVAALIGGAIGALLYLFIVKPIRRNGGYQDITLTLTFIVLATVLPSLFYIFNYWARYFADAPTNGYNLHSYDFTWGSYSGIVIMSTAACLLMILGLRYFLTRTKLGISLRAVSENTELAETMGVNTVMIHTVSWFISGALAALVGSIMTIYKGVGISGPDGLIISIMAGAIMGGVYNIYGAIIGGLFVSLAQDLLKSIFYLVFGLSALTWGGLLPLGLLLTAMMLFPNGLIGPTGLNLTELRNSLTKLRDRVLEKLGLF